MFALLSAFLWILVFNSFYKEPSFKEAVQHHARLRPAERGWRKFVFIAVRFLINLGAYNLKYFLFILFLNFALTGWRRHETLLVFLPPFFGTLLGYFIIRLRQAGKIADEPDIFYESFEEMISGQESDKSHLKRLFPLAFMSVMYSTLWYPYISASAGGGCWGEAVIYMKLNHDVHLPSGHPINGQLLDVIYWGDKNIVVKEHPYSAAHLTVIHSEDVDRAYVGSKVEEINPNWTK